MPPKGSRKFASTVNKTLVLDNGAYTLKAGLVPTHAASPGYDDCSVIPNCIARSHRDKRTYTASELDDCKDFGELAFKRPVEKGFIVNWEAEKAIWEHEFMGAKEALRCDPKETNLLLTEKPNCPRELQKNCDEIVFEQFEFAAYYRCVGTSNIGCVEPHERCITSRSAAGMPAHHRHVLLGHDDSTHVQREAAANSSAPSHSRRQAADKLRQGALVAAALQHDGGDVFAQRDQRSRVVCDAFITAICPRPRADMERESGRSEAVGQQCGGGLCIAGLREGDTRACATTRCCQVTDETRYAAGARPKRGSAAAGEREVRGARTALPPHGHRHTGVRDPWCCHGGAQRAPGSAEGGAAGAGGGGGGQLADRGLHGKAGSGVADAGAGRLELNVSRAEDPCW
ncbi:hypothetical protein OPT61_g6601 [Boeremia exigua]|uniref:Uncharacterized protein n=1 Tax=Boeremia exigua TaxID=749465 RepID=A0ACC2I5K6_9PLEO|nr:hypothetical protein OPT61_g6601 [Boeremia exigua]